MASVNKVVLVGHLGKDPESKFMASGDTVTNLTLATSESWKDKSSGEKQEKTEWHRITLYKRTAEIAAEYLKKGSLIYLEGRIETRKWTDKEGKERYSTEIIGNDLKMLGGGNGGNGAKTSAPYQLPSPSNNNHDMDIPF